MQNVLGAAVIPTDEAALPITEPDLKLLMSTFGMFLFKRIGERQQTCYFLPGKPTVSNSLLLFCFGIVGLPTKTCIF